MNHLSTDIQVWFLRHGNTPFDYETRSYDTFMDMLRNGHETPLVKEHGINFETLPNRVEFVAHSPARRAADTAEVVRKQLGVKTMEEWDVLREVSFDENIISRQEYTSLTDSRGVILNADSREVILKRWFYGINQVETFEDSFARVKEIESFLSKRPEKTIILVTHGWFLRLLDVYFVQGKHTDITLEDILATKPVPLGHCIEATVAREPRVKSQMELVGGRYSRQSRVRAR